jgi:t-SNARE complex subunit (syntaxin)
MSKQLRRGGKVPKKRRNRFFSWLILIIVLWVIARYMHYIFF